MTRAERPGRARRPTLADVAARAGVSVALVSIVMRDAPGASPESRQRVLQAADELGYRPDSRARLLRSSHSRLIGVTFGVQHPFHGDLVSGLYTAADSAGYELALSAVTPGRDERRAIASLLQDRCEALILLGPQSPTSYLADLAARLPVVVLARAVRHRALDVVRTADGQGVNQAVDHLVALGHRRIAHVDGGGAPGAAERRRGYRDALERHGLADNVHILPGGLTEDDGAAAARALLDSAPRPTAVTVFNDRCATGVLDVLHGAGLSVPRDMSVIGFDDDRLARLSHVALTTVAQDTDQMTALAVARAVSRLDGTSVTAREQVIPPTSSSAARPLRQANQRRAGLPRAAPGTSAHSALRTRLVAAVSRTGPAQVPVGRIAAAAQQLLGHLPGWPHRILGAGQQEQGTACAPPDDQRGVRPVDRRGGIRLDALPDAAGRSAWRPTG